MVPLFRPWESPVAGDWERCLNPVRPSIESRLIPGRFPALERRRAEGEHTWPSSHLVQSAGFNCHIGSSLYILGLIFWYCGLRWLVKVFSFFPPKKILIIRISTWLIIILLTAKILKLLYKSVSLRSAADLVSFTVPDWHFLSSLATTLLLPPNFA